MAVKKANAPTPVLGNSAICTPATWVTTLGAVTTTVGVTAVSVALGADLATDTDTLAEPPFPPPPPAPPKATEEEPLLPSDTLLDPLVLELPLALLFDVLTLVD